MNLYENGTVSLLLPNGVFFNCSAFEDASDAYIKSYTTLIIIIENMKFVENKVYFYRI